MSVEKRKAKAVKCSRYKSTYAHREGNVSSVQRSTPQVAKHKSQLKSTKGFLLISAALAKYLQEIQEELNDIEVQVDGSKCIVIDAELVASLMLTADDELGVVDYVE